MSDLSTLAANLPEEQKAIRAKCFHPDGAFVEFKREDIEQSISDRFEQIVRQYPDQIAIKTPERGLTYAELDATANRVARAILAKQGERGQPVVLLFDHGAQAVIAILGALKAGTLYVPLDPSFPRGRVEAILQDSGTRLIVTNRKNLGFANQLTNNGTELLDIDNLETYIPDEKLCLPLSPGTYACIMYTSGSTGEPKGVLQNHRGILHKVMVYTNLLHICPSDRLTLLHYTSFDACMHHLFGSLLNGASLLPFDLRLEGSGPLARWLIREQVSIYHSVPIVFRQLAGSLTGEEEFPHLRVINLSGYPMNTKDVDLYKDHFPLECILLHMIGTTETGWIRRYFIDKASQIAGYGVPVGYEIENKEVILLGDNGQPIDLGEIGEIAVKGRYLSQGYWRRPELTAAKFLPDPRGGDERIYLTGDLGRMSPDGCLLHLGRKDFQVKIRGHRIEIEEIEGLLQAQGNVREAVVAKWNLAGSDDERLVAYIVPIRKPVPTITELRRALTEKLPDYMVPSTFVFLDALPLTPNGKLDRRALPHPERSRPELETVFAPPTTPVEEELARIWAVILDLDRVGIHDNFFDLGGHSLAATRVVSRVLQQFQLEIPLHALFENPTIAGLAAQIAQAQAKKAAPEEMADVLTALESLSDEEAERLVAEEGQKVAR